MNLTLVFAAIVHCYVGCNAGSPDRQALHVLECDTETGAAKIVQSVKGVQGTTYFQLEGGYLYSACRVEKEAKSRLVRFPLEGWRLGEMETIAELPCETPCHVSLIGDRIAFAAYSSATAGTVGKDGKDLRTFVFPNDAMGPNKRRQKKAYAHFTFNLNPPTANHQPPTTNLGVIDLGCDRIWAFDPVTMRRIEGFEIKAEPGDGPRHAVWSKDGRFLYVLNELGSTVSAFAFNQQSINRLIEKSNNSQLIGKWSMLPQEFSRWESDGESLASKAAAIKLTADGKILMASNRGYDSIAFYAVDTASGKLTLRNIARLRGSFPRDFELMPGEKFMVVGHKRSNEIQVYGFDREACTLTPVGKPISAWMPLCFKFNLQPPTTNRQPPTT